MTLYIVNYSLLDIPPLTMLDKANQTNLCQSSAPQNEEKLRASEVNNSLPKFDIKEVEDLVFDFKENLRLSAMSCKTRVHISRKSSRASPYRVPIRCNGICVKSCFDCDIKSRRSRPNSNTEEDPFEFLQKLLQNGNLVTEAVRRLNQDKDLPPKERYFYESDDEYETSFEILTNSRRHNVSQNSSEVSE